MAVISLLAACALLVPSRAQVPTGIAISGGAEESSPASLDFTSGTGSNAHSAALFVSSEGLKVQRSDRASATLSEEVASLPSTDVRGELSVASLSLAGVKQWALWHFDSFDSDSEESAQWSSNARSSCNVVGDSFLGGHCQFAATNTSRLFSGLPDHTKVKVRARLHFIDDWEGESLMLQVDGRTAWSQSHTWCPSFFKWKCTKFGLDSCGRETPDRLSVKAEATLEHSGPELNVGFASTLAPGSDACHASWGVDDMSIEVL